MSAAINVYGFFPFVFLKCEPSVDEYSVGEFVEELERTLAEVDHLYCPKIPHWKTMKRILHYEFEMVFPVDDYHPQPIQVLKLTLAIPQYCTFIGKYFFDNKKLDGVNNGISNGNIINTPTYGAIHAHPYNCLDAATQFIMESEITGFGWISCSEYSMVSDASYDRSKANIEVNVSYKHMHVLHGDESVAPLRTFTFDIECGNTGGFPTAERDPIICVSMYLANEAGQRIKEIVVQHGNADDLGNDTDHVRFYGNDPSVSTTDIEREMLRLIGDIVNKYFDPDFIIGHNSKAFDLPYFMERAHTVGDLPNAECWSRTTPRWRPPRTVERRRKNGDTVSSKQTIIVGRIQLDTMIQIKADQLNKQSSYSLGALAQKYLGAGKDDVGYKMITPLWKTSNMTRHRLAKYNMKDSQLTFGLFDKFGMLSDTIESCRVTRTMPNTLLQSGQQVKVWAQLLHESKCPKWEPDPTLRAVIPFEIPHEIASNSKIQGATVLKPMKGFYKHPVGTGDFASLYPSIMISKCICYSTLVRNKAMIDSLTLDGKCRTSPSGATFVTQDVREGLVPKLLKKLIAARAKAKEELAKAKTPLDKIKANCKQGALKVSANSTYGFMNASGGKLRRECMAQSVTSWGRTFIDTAKTTAETEFGCTVIYGDTDSIMMIKNDIMDKNVMFDLLKKVTTRVTQIFNTFPVKLEPEKVYQPYLLMKKKRYVGYKYMNPNDKGSIDMKGIETARRDYCAYVKETLTESLNILMHEQDPSSALHFMQDSIKQLLLHNVEMHKLVITRSLSKAVYKNKQAHSELAKRMEQRDPTFHMNTGERIPYIIIWKPGKNVLVSAKSESPSVVIENDLPIDYEYYANHQLKKPCIRILAQVLVPGNEKDKVKLKKAERIIYDPNIFRHVIKKPPPVSSSVGIGKFFAKVDTCRLCNSPICGPRTENRDPIYCTRCIETNKPAIESDQKAIMQNITDIEDAHKIMRAKCATCRGFDDDTPCVQIDCALSFKKAICARNINKAKTHIYIW
ncbi:MAG: DNA polymerase domain-containing protein [Methylococcales bacterium]|nr:DNA polymerase domain-containing protein [Methylococcales bacterium]